MTRNTGPWGAGWPSGSDRTGFGKIVVEFGNENWNSLFRPAELPKPEA